MNTLTKSFISCLVVFSLIGCGTETNISQVVSAGSYEKSLNAAQVYGKQGAAVSLVNNKVTLAASGVQYSIELAVNSQYESANMVMTVSSSDGLYIVSGETRVEQTITKGEMVFPFDVTAMEDGRHYLRAVVEIEHNGIKEFRALSMIVIAGEQGNVYEKTGAQNSNSISVQTTEGGVLKSSSSYQAKEEIIKK